MTTPTQRSHRPLFIGIAGPSGAGKTTLCEQLQNRSSRIQHIRLDDYLRSPRTFPRLKGFVNWEHPRNLNFGRLIAHLARLAAGKIVRTRTGTIRPAEFVVIEGFLLFRDRQVRRMLNVRIYMDIPPAFMIRRRTKRQARIRGSRWLAEEYRRYDREVTVPEYCRHGLVQKKYADYILDARRPPPVLYRQVTHIIHNSS